jgi:DNA polymerase-3 subunit gamma/tau
VEEPTNEKLNQLMSQALYRKWRPQSWDQVVGQQHIVQTLRNAIAADRVGHAYLFAGPRGTGKTTTARLLAKAVNCQAPDPEQRPCNECDYCRAVNEGRFLDLIEIDAASNTSVDDVRELRDKINYAPTQGKYKVYIIDEVHMLSTAAFNALLKTLEEPPSHAIFILATTEVHKIPATVLSRCQRHEFRRIPVPEVVGQLEKLAEQEGIPVERDALVQIARQGTGSMRDSISLLDQLASMEGTVTLERAQTVLGTATSQVVIDVVDAIIQQQPAEGLLSIHHALDAGADARQLARQMVDYLRNLLLVRMGSADQVEATQEAREMMAKHAQAFAMPQLLKTLDAFKSAAIDQRGGWQPALLLEMALASALEEEAAPSAQPVMAAPVAVSPSHTATVVEAPAAAVVPAPEPSIAPTDKKKRAASPAPAPAAEPVAAPADPEPQTTEGANLTISNVQQNWRQIASIVRQHNLQTEALLRSCKPTAIKDGALILTFSSELLRSKMEKEENLELVRRAVNMLFKVNIPVHCVVSGVKASAASADLDVDSDGMVGTALRDLGGEVTDIQ